MGLVLKYLGLMLLNAFGLIFVYAFLSDDNLGLAIVFAVITVGLDIIFLVPGLYPLRWMAPGLALITLLVIYPIIFTVTTAFTNRGDGHLLPKDQTIELITSRGYVPEDARTYNWVPFRRGEDEYALWLVDTENGDTLFARPGEPLQPVDTQALLGVDLTTEPPVVSGYEIVEDTSALAELPSLTYPDPIGEMRIDTLNLDVRYIYDVTQNLTFDQNRGDTYLTTVYVNDNGEFAFWLVESLEALEGLYVVPGADLESVDLDNRTQIDNAGLKITTGSVIPTSIGDFQKVDDPLAYEDALKSIVVDSVRRGFVAGTFDLTDRFVYDPQQGIALDQQTGTDFEVVAYINENGDYALWMDGGRSGTYLARVDREILFNGVPATYEGYNQIISNRERTDALRFLQNIPVDYFGAGDDTVGISGLNTAGRPYLLRYEYDAERDAIIDTLDGTVYFADEQTGFFVREGGSAENNDDHLNPGYVVYEGFQNFIDLVQDPGLRGPLVSIFMWTVVFAGMSVLLTFALGLFMALVLEDPIIPGRRIIRSLLIIPYAIPGVIAILVWKGMLNQNIGIITATLADWTGVTIPWFTDAGWAKVAVLLVNLWLGYPYMMLICSGALQAIPSEIYEAAAVDGAKAWQRFRSITLPLLLVAVGPLLIASFVFNFNNYLMIEALTGGDPPMAGATLPAGHTDILISYTYQLAFGNQGRDYGYASTITIVIFAIVAVVTMFQFRFTRQWEEVGENV